MDLLSLEKNPIGDSGMDCVAQSMTKIKEINLNKCKVQENGLIKLECGFHEDDSVVSILNQLLYSHNHKKYHCWLILQ